MFLMLLVELKENELWLPLATKCKIRLLSVTDEFMFQCWNFNLTSTFVPASHFFCCVNRTDAPDLGDIIELIYLMPLIPKKWKFAAGWQQNKDLLPPQYGAGRPPSFVLGCWKGHQETRVWLRREENAKVNAHQLCERGQTPPPRKWFRFKALWISALLFCPITSTDHRPK